jgi:hypothetical protein
MELRIRLESGEPPEGWVDRPGDEQGPVQFSGWLGLLRALELVLARH